MGLDVVWLKRDVRLHDHEPLTIAANSGRKFIILFMYEPDQLKHETVHGSHVHFVNEGLAEMDRRLQHMSQGQASAHITFQQGEAVSILQALHDRGPLLRLLSHQETGHRVSFSRDQRVANWCKMRGVQWVEIPQSTVIRGISPAGNAWLEVWEASVETFVASKAWRDAFSDGPHALERLECVDSIGLQTPDQLGITYADDRPSRQHGGEHIAKQILHSFLQDRCEGYSGGISSPNSAWTACSRLSPYLSWGHISIRTVWQAVQAKLKCASGKAAKSLKAFLVRFHWRGHNCQRFEMRHWIEHTSLCEAWEHLREGRTFFFASEELLGELAEDQRIKAFEQGRTGYPMVDACMRCLLNTGWLNFRMRCMLVSFAIFNLWLDWRAIASHLARCFLDFEPGIHYSQLQMQAGTTGADMRCYSITKQAKEHDPKGVFIRRYVTELAEVPDKFVHEPWKCPAAQLTGYPSRIVDEVKTSQAAKKVMSFLQKWAQSAVHGQSPPSLEEIHASSPSGPCVKKRLRTLEPNRSESGANLMNFFRKPSKEIDALDTAHRGSALCERSDPGQGCDQKVTCCTWSCPQCTLINTSSDNCLACDLPRPLINPNMLGEVIDLEV